MVNHVQSCVYLGMIVYSGVCMYYRVFDITERRIELKIKKEERDGRAR